MTFKICSTVNRTPIQFIFLVFSVTTILSSGCNADTNTASADTPLARQLRGIYSEQPLVDLAAKYLEPYPNKMENLIVGNDSTLFHAMAAYDAGDYVLAVKLFPNYTRKPEQIGYIHLYKGISELLSGKQYDAFKTFQRIPSRHEKPFDVSNWYLAMNQVVFNNKQFIRDKLHVIIEKNGYGADRAPLVLKDLERYEKDKSSK